MKPSFKINKFECKYGDHVAFTTSDLDLVSGRSVAIVGLSGAGKSTFIKSLAGLIQPSVWESDVSWDVLKAHCSFVSQTPFLFSSTLRSNLLYGLSKDVESLTTDEMLYGALRVVGLDVFVKQLPNGLETLFDPLALNFSGGQVQRFVVSRALLTRKPILLMDEGMSAIDGAAEREMTKVLCETVKETGTILLSVTHRPTWLSTYAEVWYIKDGRILMRGPHEELLKNPGYQEFVSAGSIRK